MKVGSLFSGIGGFDEGLRRAGMQTIWMVENDKACRQVLSKRFPDVPIFEDIRHVKGTELEPVDLICGGFPCQDLSVAGKRAGLAGDRSGLWHEFHRIIRELSPQWVLIENVPGLLSSNGGRDFAVILSGLGRWGYLTAWRVLDSQYAGVAQRRRRVFVVGSLGTGGCAEVLFEQSCLCGHSPQSKKTGTGTPDSIARSLGNVGGGNDYGANKGTLAIIPDPAYCLAAGEGGSKIGSGRDSQDTFVVNFERGLAPHGSMEKKYKVDELSASEHKRQTMVCYPDPVKIVSQEAQGDENLAPCLKERMGTGGNQVPLVQQATMVRRLTPLECERLQGFPDNWTAGLSDTQRYRTLGQRGYGSGHRMDRPQNFGSHDRTHDRGF